MFFNIQLKPKSFSNLKPKVFFLTLSTHSLEEKHPLAINRRWSRFSSEEWIIETQQANVKSRCGCTLKKSFQNVKWLRQNAAALDSITLTTDECCVKPRGCCHTKPTFPLCCVGLLSMFASAPFKAFTFSNIPMCRALHSVCSSVRSLSMFSSPYVLQL